jgi:hypothetical protein
MPKGLNSKEELPMSPSKRQANRQELTTRELIGRMILFYFAAFALFQGAIWLGDHLDNPPIHQQSPRY